MAIFAIAHQHSTIAEPGLVIFSIENVVSPSHLNFIRIFMLGTGICSSASSSSTDDSKRVTAAKNVMSYEDFEHQKENNGNHWCQNQLENSHQSPMPKKVM
jgi:hypothetical protein